MTDSISGYDADSNKNKKARPWDYLNPSIHKVELDISQKRMAVCRSCARYISFTSTCKECGCIMPIKSKLPHAFCPIGKWSAETQEENNKDEQ